MVLSDGKGPVAGRLTVRNRVCTAARFDAHDGVPDVEFAGVAMSRCHCMDDRAWRMEIADTSDTLDTGGLDVMRPFGECACEIIGRRARADNDQGIAGQSS